MKKWIFAIVGGLLLVAAVTVFCVKAANRDALTDFEKANIEALASVEITVGNLCAWDPNYDCLSLNILVRKHSKVD